MSAPIQLRLRYVQRVSFQKSEATHWTAFVAANPDLAATFKGDDCVCFISKGGDQMVFAYGYNTLAANNRIYSVLRSQRLRLRSGSWSPLMLQNYAEQVGIRFQQIKRFEEIYAEARRRKQEAAL